VKIYLIRKSDIIPRMDRDSKTEYNKLWKT
jgi:hypothetical protein